MQMLLYAGALVGEIPFALMAGGFVDGEVGVLSSLCCLSAAFCCAAPGRTGRLWDCLTFAGAHLSADEVGS